MVCTVIIEKLVCSVLLGHPFLKFNQMLIDHATLSCIMKETGFDLLKKAPLINMPLKEAPKPPPEANTLCEMCEMLHKLVQHTAIQKAKLDDKVDHCS